MDTRIHLGTVVGSAIAANRDGEGDSRMLSAELSEADDVQTIELVNRNGEQTNPLDDHMLVILELGPAWKIAVAVRDNVELDATLARGEKILYSLDATNAIKASVRFKADGTLVLNEGEDYAVQFTAMQSAFNQLKSDFNTFVSSVFNAHTHPYLPGPGPAAPTSPTATPGSSSSADMAGAKIESIQVP